MSFALEIAELIEKHHPEALKGDQPSLTAAVTDLSDNLGSLLATSHRFHGEADGIVRTMLERMFASAESIDPGSSKTLRRRLLAELR